jgi:hypothetical protein
MLSPLYITPADWILVTTPPVNQVEQYTAGHLGFLDIRKTGVSTQHSYTLHEIKVLSAYCLGCNALTVVHVHQHRQSRVFVHNLSRR